MTTAKLYHTVPCTQHGQIVEECQLKDRGLNLNRNFPSWVCLKPLNGHFSHSEDDKPVDVQLSFIEFDDGKTYRKPPYLMIKTMVSG